VEKVLRFRKKEGSNMRLRRTTAAALRPWSDRLALVRPRARGLSSAPTVFDRSLKRHHRERAALSDQLPQYSYLRDEIAERLAERLEDIHETYAFDEAVDLCSGNGHLRRALAGGRGGVRRLLELDSSPAMLAASAADEAASRTSGTAEEDEEEELEVERREMDDECPRLEVASTDLIMSSMALHWVNDLPGTLSACRRALRPNGLFLGAMLGGETLAEMRSAFVLADLERHGGVAQRMSPLCSVSDAGALMQAAGFALPTVDTEVLTVRYPDAWTLWHHLRAMGESHATTHRATADRSTLLAAASIYAEMYADADGTIPASFQLIYMTGWAPHESQQRPLARGSAQLSLKDLNLPDFGGGDGGNGRAS
jgi:NADH dehydrogenase [ubiquinone] 1 alpha subcomplex assembly factor 5